MALKLLYYGQNDGSTTPDVLLTGDPGTDQQTLTTAGFLGGVIVGLCAPLHATGLVAIVPCDTEAVSANGVANIPYATLLNGPGEFAGAIGPSGSKKAPVVRAFWAGCVNSEAFDANSIFAVGQYVYCGTGPTKGQYVSYLVAGAKGKLLPVGICTHAFTAAEPWVGVASLL